MGNPTTWKGAALTFDRNNGLASYTTGQTQQLTAGYRADGLRAWKESDGATAYYLYDGDMLLAEMDADGTVTTYNTWGPTGLLNRANLQTNRETWYLFDPLGNVAQRTDAAGHVLSADQYDAWGNLLAGGDAQDPYGYNGQYGYYTDHETGLILCTHRYYDPQAGRWLTQDPIGYLGGMNLYGYCSGDPINCIDPLGLWTWDNTFGVLKAVGGAAEILTGVTSIAATGGLAALPGIIATAHGADILVSGINEAITGRSDRSTDTYTSQFLQGHGVSRTNANLIDAGIGVVGSLACGIANAAVKATRLAAKYPAATAGLNKWQILWQYDRGSMALPDDAYTALGGDATTPYYKYPYIKQGFVIGEDGTRYNTKVPYMRKACDLIGTGATPLASALGWPIGSAVYTSLRQYWCPSD